MTSRLLRRQGAPDRTTSDAQLGATALGAARWSFANTLVVRLLTVLSGVVLARILAPEDFGVLAAALVLSNILLSVTEMGASVALVRTVGDVSRVAPTVVTISWVSSLALAALCWALAPASAALSGVPASADVLRLLALALPLAGLSAVPGAIVQREFRQDRKAAAEVVGAVVGIVVAVVMAVEGYGVWSLAWQRVAGLAATALVLCVLAPERHRPGWDREVAKQVLGLGLPLAGSSLVVMAAMNVDYLLVGRLLGVEALGFYLLAFNLASWPVAVFSAPARNVSVAWFSHLRERGAAAGDGLARMLEPLVLVTVPVCLLLAVAAEPLLGVLYGERWTEAAVSLSILAALGIGRVLVEAAYDLLVAMGRAPAILGVYLLWLLVLVPSLWVGAEVGGLAGVSLAQVAVLLLVVVPTLVGVLRRSGVHLGGAGRALVVPALAGAALVAVAVVLRNVPGPDLVRVVVLGGAGGSAYLGVVVLLRGRVLAERLAVLRGAPSRAGEG